MKPVRTWILIADAGRARVLQNLGPGKGLTPVDGMASEASLPATHDMMTDRQGRGHESANPAHHAIEPKTDPREQLKHHYLAAQAQHLDRSLGADAFDRLVVVAPPHALGLLRSAFTHRLKAAIKAEIAKDLTKTPDHELASHLEDYVSL
jgi:protein required for attachment to host cells